MRTIFKWIIGVAVAYWIFALIIAVASAYWKWSVGVKYIVTTEIQLFAGFATFAAVLISLFSAAIKRKFDRPQIVLSAACDDEHCVLNSVDNTKASTYPKRILEIYASAKNTVGIEAQDAQMICKKAFVSQDGVRFVLLRTFRSASFKWLYSSDDRKFLTTLRHSVEKYAKVIEIVDAEVEHEGDGKPGDVALQTRSREVHFEICLSLNEEKTANIVVGGENRAILLSMCLASSCTDPLPFYLKVYLKSGNLETMPDRERLEIKLISEAEAQAAVAVKLG